MRLIDADELKKKSYRDSWNTAVVEVEEIDKAPTVDYPFYQEAYQTGYEEGKNERPQGECKSCKYYHPYYKQFSDEPRGDGYCVIARMTPEGMTTINCNDEFGCSDYQKGGAK